MHVGMCCVYRHVSLKPIRELLKRAPQVLQHLLYRLYTDMCCVVCVDMRRVVDIDMCCLDVVDIDMCCLDRVAQR